LLTTLRQRAIPFSKSDLFAWRDMGSKDPIEQRGGMAWVFAFGVVQI
jgi:hypothetical protein